ncbi:MAG: class I SAM-dependent methyltransferase [Myxococcota bacterium]
MEKLSDQEHWNDVHRGAERADAAHYWGARALKRRVARWLPDDFVSAVSNYREHVLWKHYYGPHMPRGGDKRVIEIGSAPGTHLVRLHQAFGLSPYGLEYSPNGAALNREMFERNGIPPAQVIEADFFSSPFLEAHEATFDAVVSRGFIEHFDDVADVVDRHVRLLKPGGTLAILIPNFGGWLNQRLCSFFCPEQLPMHNLTIMQPDAFGALFDRPDLVQLELGLVGRFDFGLVSTKSAAKKPLLKLLHKGVQPVLNLAYAQLPVGLLEGGGHSMSFVYMGRRRL